MKKLNLLLILTITTTILFAQKEVKDKNWAVGSEKKIEGTIIKRIEGVNTGKKVTNIGYQTQKQMIAEVKRKSKEGRIGGTKLKSQLKQYKDYCAGGMIQLYIERGSGVTANTNNFTVIIKNKKDKELYKKKFKQTDPKQNKDGSFRNKGFAWINIKLTETIFIYIEEKGKDEIFKFEVNLPKK